ncbi:MAG TPA: MerR family transcriptional regulator [Melioribacteraceae bacterium]|nr:MerR family transcriptional regulator [Melioribacteraceae bacterium]
MKKLYYSISEVSKLAEVEQYILRYWESEFEQLRPSKNRAGNRVYTNEDIKLIFKIKKLLRDEKYTVEGAKRVLIDGSDKIENIDTTSDNEPEVEEIIDEKEKLKRDLMELRNFLVDLKRYL